jgi:hypothetical protein
MLRASGLDLKGNACIQVTNQLDIQQSTSHVTVPLARSNVNHTRIGVPSPRGEKRVVQFSFIATMRGISCNHTTLIPGPHLLAEIVPTRAGPARSYCLRVGKIWIYRKRCMFPIDPNLARFSESMVW